MSKLTLDEAIKHCLEVAEKNECKMTSDDGYTDVSMKRCAAEHRQLAEWLTDYEGLRAEIIDLRLYVQMLEKYREEAKRLLKAAVEDIHKTHHHRDECCNICKNKQTCTINCAFVWQHEAEALALIGEEGVNK